MELYECFSCEYESCFKEETMSICKDAIQVSLHSCWNGRGCHSPEPARFHFVSFKWHVSCFQMEWFSWSDLIFPSVSSSSATRSRWLKAKGPRLSRRDVSRPWTTRCSSARRGHTKDRTPIRATSWGDAARVASATTTLFLTSERTLFPPNPCPGLASSSLFSRVSCVCFSLP